MAKKAEVNLYAKAAALFIPNGRANAMPAANGIPLWRKKSAAKVFLT